MPKLSPIKSKRLEEKVSLQKLNSRLEEYVLGVNGLEEAKLAAEQELETIRVRMQVDLDSTRARLTKELEETRKKLDTEMDLNARLQILEQEHYEELVKFRAQQTEFEETKVLMESLKVQLEREKAHAEAAKVKFSEQSTLFASSQQRVKELEREVRGHASALSDSTLELTELRKKCVDFEATREVEITKIRQEFTMKYQESQAQWIKDTDERLQTMETEVRGHFVKVSNSLETQLVEVRMELEATKKELNKTTAEFEEILKERQVLTEKVAQLERVYCEERTRATKERKNYEETMERYRTSKLSKEVEFNELMDVKIALDAEIMKYRRILDREISRVAEASRVVKVITSSSSSSLISSSSSSSTSTSSSSLSTKAVSPPSKGMSTRKRKMESNGETGTKRTATA